jgi:probable addiction module antidote protein
MPKRTYTAGLHQRFRDEPRYAEEYLNAALEDSNETFLVALRDVAEARTMTALAKDARLNRESLYRTLSRNGNPQLRSLTAVLAAFGLKLRVEAR